MPVVRITGTNGKGSVVALIEAQLLNAGYDTVVLGSPHCYTVRERIRLNGVVVDMAELIQAVLAIAPVIEGFRGTAWQPKPTDVWTWSAFHLHRSGNADRVGVYEVGKGGRNDVVNVFEKGVVGLTNIGHDHLTEFGGTQTTLLLEKLGLCSIGDVLCHGPLAPEHELVLQAYCAQIGVEIKRTEAVELTDSIGLDLEERQNLELSDLVVQALGLSDKRMTVPHAALPGRLQERWVGGRLFLLDGAHNKEAIERTLRRCAEHPARGRLLIFACQSHKDWRSLVQLCSRIPSVDLVLCTQATIGECVEPLTLSHEFHANGRKAFVLPGMRSALQFAMRSEWEECVVSGTFKLLRDFDLSLHALGMSQYAVPFSNIDPIQSWMRPLK